MLYFVFLFIYFFKSNTYLIKKLIMQAHVQLCSIFQRRGIKDLYYKFIYKHI